MFFVTTRTKAQFYNDSQMTFLVRKDWVDIIFKIQKGVYLIVNVYALSEGRLLLACSWEGFFNRLKSMRNRDQVLARLKKSCPLASNIFSNTVAPHFAYIDKEQMQGAVVIEMKAPVSTDSKGDLIHDKVVEKAMELMKYNLNLQVELENNSPFPLWKTDLQQLQNS